MCVLGWSFMKIIDGVKQLRGCPVEIPDCTRDDLPQFFVDMGYKVGAEIGVWKGEFSEKLCQVGLKMYAIDPWVGFSGQGRTQKKQEVQDQYYAEAKARLERYSNCTIIRETSLNALSHFRKHELDFVFIDGDHTLQAVIVDNLGWNEKVRPGGVISGHDYFCTWHGARNVICQVRPAVKACVEVLGIENYYIIDTDSKYPSWLWIKPN